MLYRYFVVASFLAYFPIDGFSVREYLLARSGQLTQGPVSESTRAYTFKLCEELGVSKNINLEQPLESVGQSNPEFRFAKYLAGRLFINEEKINQLPQQEKKLVLGSQLASLQNLDRLKYLRLAASLSAAYGSYALANAYGISRWIKIPGTLVVAYGVDTCANYAVYRPVKKYIRRQAATKVREKFSHIRSS